MNHIAHMMLAAAVLVTGCSEEDGTSVGPRGGVVVSDDGLFSLEIPAGALDQDVDITVDEVACEQATAIGPCYEVGPVGMPLLYPGTVVYTLDDDTLAAVGSTDTLEVLTEREEDWKPLADRHVDMSTVTVTASAVYLSSYAVVAMD